MNTNIPVESIIKGRLNEVNASIAALQANIQTQAKSSIYLANLLKNKKASEKQVFEAFSDVEEEKAEEAIKANPAPVVTSIAEHIETIKKARSFTEIMAEKRAAKDDLGSEIIPNVPVAFKEDKNAVTTLYAEETESPVIELPEQTQQEKETQGTQESFSLNVILNEKQLIGKEMAFAGKSFCMVGPAGTGKTTAQRAISEALLDAGKLQSCNFKSYSDTGEREYKSAPSIAAVAFTRRAAGNLRKAIHKSPRLAQELKHNVMTIHALLEFEPETYYDPVDQKDKFRFTPRRTASNPLTITHLIIEEASMLDAMTLWGYLYDALPSGVQIIFIGDINQLPPVFGPSILNYALVQLPIVELTQVYRNQGIVLENAHNILAGKSLAENENFVIVRGKSPVQLGQEKLSIMFGAMFNQWLDMTGSDGLPEYDPADCIILSPWNVKPLGTHNMNHWIAQHLGTRRNAIVHEVIAGFNKLYLAVGDKVMFNKMDGIITDIHRNPGYSGREPQLAGSDLTRFGMRIIGANGKDDLDELGLDYTNFSIEQLEREKAERKQQATHVVDILLETGETKSISAAGDFSEQSFSLGYCLTVHKAQGSEWRKVFIILHKEQAISLYRELFYTAVTRARTKVTILTKDSIIEKCLSNQRIKGNTMADKIEYFNSGVMSTTAGDIYATK